MSENIDQRRRGFFTAAAATLAAVKLAGVTQARAQSSNVVPTPQHASMSQSNASFATTKQLDAGLLNVGYVEFGLPHGHPVVLLHGWPYDIHSFVEVAPILARAGFRVIVPYLRGYGSTRFRSNDTLRNGQPAAVAADIVAFMDALRIEKATLAGFDWGARTANIIAAFGEFARAIVDAASWAR